MNKVITSDDILGKEAVDPDGCILGIVVKLHISAGQKLIMGITIDQGFMRPDLYIGIDHIKFFGVDTVMLSKVPETRFQGMMVLTEEGNDVGRVKDVVMDKKKITMLRITRGMRKKDFFVAAEDIKEIGSSILLRKTFTAHAAEERQ